MQRLVALATFLVVGCTAPPPVDLVPGARSKVVQQIVAPNVATPTPPPQPIAPEQSRLANPLQVEFLAGGGEPGEDGIGSAAGFSSPECLAIDSHGDLVVVDRYGSSLRRVTPSGDVTTLREGGWSVDPKRRVISVSGARSVAVDQHDHMFVAGANDNRVYDISPAGVTTPIAGDGTFGYKEGRGEEARFQRPEHIALAPDGTLYVSEFFGRIRRITPDGDSSLFAGGRGLGLSTHNTTIDDARFSTITGLVFDNAGQLFISETYGSTLRWVDKDGRFVTDLTSNAGGFVDGDRTVAKMERPAQVVLDAAHNFYVTDTGNHAIRRMTPRGDMTTLVGDGYDGQLLGLNDRARLHSPSGVAVTPDGSILYIADTGNDRILKVVLKH